MTVPAAEDVLNLIWLVPAMPLAGAVVLLFFGKRIGEPLAGWLATLSIAGSFAASAATFVALASLDGHERRFTRTLFTWIESGSFEAKASFYIDPLSVTMILFVTGVGALIHLYAIGYMHGDERFGRFFAYLNLFAFSMLILVLGGNFLLTFVGWEGVGLCSYLLISFWFERPSAASAGKKAFVTNRIGDFGFLLAMFLIVAHIGTLEIGPALEGARHLTSGTATAIALLLFLGAVGKSAQLPLLVWLPDAMEGPTPVSALIHAATMVTAGVYLVARAHPFFEMSPTAGDVVAWTGAITALVAATIALVHNDIKRVLAYSTISQLGYMFLAVGVGAYTAGIFHMVTHAFFKALLFLGAGSVIHGLHDEQDMRRMGALRRFMPITAGTFIVAWLAIAGVPPFAGFWSKDEILAKAFFGEQYLLWGVGLVTALLTAFYMTRQVFLVFFGNARFDTAPSDAEHSEVEHSEVEHSGTEPHESPWLMTFPLMALAGLAAVAGLLNLPFKSLEFFGKWLEPVFEGVHEVHAESFAQGLTLSIIAVGMGVAGIVAARNLYVRGLDGEDPVARGLGPVGRFFGRGWGIDGLYASAIERPGRWIADRLATDVDQRGIDGAVNGVGWLARRSGDALRRTQAGLVRRYALAVFMGGTVLVVLITARSLL